MMRSSRAKRMQRHHKRGKSGVALNLVSLMDIFTILVFFLLVNSTEVEVLPNAKDIQLPESIAETKARETVVVMVTDEEILVQGTPVESVSQAMAADSLVIDKLESALRAQSSRLVAQASDEALEVTIMGDKTVPYRLLKRIMATCGAAEYVSISLAVMQKAPEKSAARAAVTAGASS